MSWEEFRRKARIIEENFAKNLTDVVKATKNQDMYEHWDMVGKLDNKVLSVIGILIGGLMVFFGVAIYLKDIQL